MQLTPLSRSGRARLSSRHSFRYLAETFSFSVAFSKTCFIKGVFQPASSLPLSTSFPRVSFSLCVNLLPCHRILLPSPHHALISSHYPIPGLKRIATCVAPKPILCVSRKGPSAPPQREVRRNENRDWFFRNGARTSSFEETGGVFLRYRGGRIAISLHLWRVAQQPPKVPQ